MVDLRDPRVDSWLDMYSIWPTIIICSAYVYFVKVLGPRLMKDREPFELKKILLVYNFSQVLFSLWMFMEGWGFYISGNYSWHCEPVDYSSPQSQGELSTWPGGTTSQSSSTSSTPSSSSSRRSL